jgi:hypothetical protein
MATLAVSAFMLRERGIERERERKKERELAATILTSTRV